jgi:hypothetical protein
MSDPEDFEENYVTLPHTTAFSGINNVAKRYKLSTKAAEDALSTIYSYTLHREYKKPRFRNPYFIYRKRQQIQMDLIDVHALARYNGGVCFLLVAIDGFTRRVWLEPLRRKNTADTLKGIQRVMRQMTPPPKSILCDEGGEFKNRQVLAYFRSKGITVHHPFSDVKASIAERVNRTLKGMIHKYLTENQTNAYILVLPDIRDAYNARGHRSLDRMSPDEAELPANKNEVLNALNKHYSAIVARKGKPANKFKIGDTVRIKTLANVFARGFHPTFTTEYFSVVKINQRMPITTYNVKSLNTEEVIRGAFYQGELQRCGGDVWKIEKVLKRRTRRGVRQIFVKWLHFDNAHNSWVNVRQDVVADYGN